MADTIVLAQPVYFKVWNQPMLVEAGSTVVVASAGAFAPSQISNVQLGTGSLTSQGHNQGGANFKAR
jgi:hypothetical protein